MTTYQIQIINHHLRAMQAYLLNIPVLGWDTLLIIPSRKIHMVSLSVWLSSNFSSCFRLRQIWHRLFGLFLFCYSKIISTDNFEPFLPIVPLFRLFDLSGHLCSRSTKYFIRYELVFKTKIFVQKYGDPCFSVLYFCSLLVWFLLSDYILFRFL